MNHYAPREILDAEGKGTGRWHYTVRNDRDQPGHASPVGHCGAFRKCPDCDGHLTNLAGVFVCDIPEEQGGPHCKACNGKGCIKIPEAERCPGHATPEEACAHYKEYLLDSARYSGPKTQEWPKHKCEAADCNSEATHLISIPGEMQCYEVCAAHHNRATLTALLSVGQSLSS